MRRHARTSTPGSKISHTSRAARPRLVSAARGSLATLAGVFTLAGFLAAGCDDEDTSTVINTGGNAGNGMSGNGGSGNGGSNAGSAGMGGSSAGNAGTGGGAGSGGTGGDSQGGSGNDPDAGDAAPVDGGDGGTVLDRVAVATAMCAKLDAVDACSALPDCVNAQISGWDFLIEFSVPNCPEAADAYYVCMSTAPQDDFVCMTDQPGYAVGDPTGACADEENAALLAPDPSCAP